MNFNFGEVLTRAWQIIWKHKILWVFGIFASCSRGGGGNGGSGGNGGNGNQQFPQWQQTMDQIGRWISENTWIVVVAVIVVLLIIVLAIFLGTIGRIGLIKGTQRAEQGAERLIFGELFSESTPYFWRVFGLSLLIGLISLLIFLPLIFFGVITAGVGFICLLPLLCILVPVLWAVSVVIEQANAAIVLENLGIGDGLRRGWEVVRTNPGPMFILALILFIGSGVIGFIIALPVIAAVLPFVFGAATNNTNPIWFGVACCAIYFPILLVLNGILTAYMQTVWALTYMRLTKPRDNAPVIVEANAS
jgi:membrane-anchored glycerophosphoryl diester phosphodiesterase (GDPDase)